MNFRPSGTLTTVSQIFQDELWAVGRVDSLMSLQKFSINLNET